MHPAISSFRPWLSSSLRMGFVLGALLGVGVVEASAQTTVSWGAATTISGDSDVLTTGTLVSAYSFYRIHDNPNQTTNNPTVNGVTFTSLLYNATGTGAGGVTTAFSATGVTSGVTGNATFGSPAGTFSSNANPFASLSASYRTLLGSAAYASGQTNQYTGYLTLGGLTVGTTYNLQIWVNDSRGVGRNSVYSDGQGHTVTLQYDTTGINGGVGQYAVGSFTAQTSSLVISFVSGGGGDDLGVQLNAVQLRTSPVPEPSTYAALAGAAALAVAVHRRRRAPRSLGSPVAH